METINEIIDEAKKAGNLSSDAELARKIGITGATVSYWRSGRQAPDTYALMQLQGILKKDARELLAIIEAERSKDEKRRDYWVQVKNSFRTTTAAALVALSFWSGLGSDNSANASQSLQNADNSNVYYVKLRRLLNALRRSRRGRPFCEFCPAL